MDNTSYGSKDMSPVGSKIFKRCNDVQQLYNDLLLHVKQKKNISRQELKFMAAKVKQMKPGDHKNRRVLMKVKGLLKYLLDKPCDFRTSLAKGEIAIYAKTLPEEQESSLEVMESCGSSLASCSYSQDDVKNYKRHDFVEQPPDSQKRIPAIPHANSELNMKIIRENCEQFKKKLAHSDRLDFIEKLAGLSNIDYK